MKPAPFDYHAPREVDEALELLARYGAEAKILAGGQSLVPAMNLRLARPRVLVDINRIAELAYLRREENRLSVGALTRHRDLEKGVDNGPLALFLSEAAALVAHPPIRIRGTLAGSLAFADPSAEWCSMAILLDAEVVVASARGRRTIPAAELLSGAFRTTLGPDEVLLEVRFPDIVEGRGAIIEQSHTRGDFAVVVAAAYAGPPGPERDVRVVVGGASPVPIRLQALEDSVSTGRMPDLPQVSALIENVLDPPGDTYGSPAYRRHLAAVLASRALEKAMG